MHVVTFGETMILMTPTKQGPLDAVWEFQKGMAGAESNVAIALARLGHAVAWISKLGADSFGRFIYKTLRGEGVDVSHVQFDEKRPTGVFFKEFMGGRTHAYYYRSNSAASQLHPDDIPLMDFSEARYLVVTGITPALSPLNQQTTFQSIEQAHQCGMQVVFDPNIRRKLWSVEEARPVLNKMASQADIVLPGIEEGSILTRHTHAPEIAQALLDNGAQLVVVKLGPQGAYYHSSTDKGYVSGFQVHLVEEVGAGDAFTAGLLSGLLDHLDVPAAVKRACALGALAVTGTGDYESLPDRHTLDVFLTGLEEPGR
jgi:2-dehydro-3-deoxygluconokinase